MIHLYIGDGKGKSTAAAGLCLRMAGYGRKILYVQFLKNGGSGEVSVLKSFCDVVCDNRCEGFLRSMDEEKCRKAKENIRKMLSEINAEKYDLVVLDEILDCIAENIITEDDCISIFNETTEFVLTGRSAPEKLKSIADYISEIKKVKHPFDDGHLAREGIEY